MIDHETQPYLSLRDSISGLFTGSNKKSKEEFWALNDVSFDVIPGDTVGIIGKNGAGKSTLLKILSKITPPSKGKITSRGRIASLLEVGTGFHPELTGRENIFMNGSILGMRKAEIQKNFDAIVDFSGVERFLDTPLKHYSSGMQLRLAFAVAAFLENEILIIDEVLAVGDAEFQKKCLGKMQDVSKSGRTVLFVSHNMTALESLCERSVLLVNGKVRNVGLSKQIIHEYLETNLHGSLVYNDSEGVEKGNEFIKIKHAAIENVSNKQSVLDVTSEIDVKLNFVNHSKEDQISVGFDLLTIKGDVVFGSGDKFICKKGEQTELTCRIPGNFLNDDTYQVYVYFHTSAMNTLYENKELLMFDIKDIQRSSGYLGKINGFVRPKLKWNQK